MMGIINFIEEILNWSAFDCQYVCSLNDDPEIDLSLPEPVQQFDPTSQLHNSENLENEILRVVAWYTELWRPFTF